MINEWIKCSDRLPDRNGWYLVYRKNYELHTSYFNKDFRGLEWEDRNSMEIFFTDPTHWMKLPKKPKK